MCHHGGAGTTAAGLRAGKPSIICPFFGDQPFWGQMVANRKVGLFWFFFFLGGGGGGRGGGGGCLGGFVIVLFFFILFYLFIYFFFFFLK